MTGMPLFASDLDRTLIHPHRTVPEALRGEAVTVEIFEGREITVASPGTLEHLATLAARGAFVPVTTRSREQLARIEPVWALAREGWAICANGAIVLHEGREDPAWAREAARVCGACASPAEVEGALALALGTPRPESWLLRMRRCEDRFLYAICDLARTPPDARDQAQAAVAELGWEATLHGRKLYVLPAALTKVACVRHLQERLARADLLAAGDSLLDATLLAAADVAWAPRDSELVEHGQVPAGVRVTAGVHVAAGGEIAAAAVGLTAARAAA